MADQGGQPLVLKKKLQCCPTRYHLPFVRSKKAILVLIWDIAFSFYTNATRMILINLLGPISVFEFSSSLFIVLAGLLADGWIGRYRSVMASFIFGLITWIIVGVSIISTNIPILAFGIALLLITSALFRANIIPFNIDQLVEASGDELSAIVQWHFLGSTIGFILTGGLCYFLADEQIGMYWYLSGYSNVYLFAPAGLAFLVVIISHSLFKQWLDITHHSTNPVKLVAKVLNYARKNKQPTNRSALTFWLNDYPPRLDVGKEKYGGPFSEEEVEDVKTVLRLISLILCFSCFGSTWDVQWNAAAEMNLSSEPLSITVNTSQNDRLEMILSYGAVFVVAILFILLYYFFIYPCFYNYIPSMLKRIGLGLSITLAINVSYMIIVFVSHFVVKSKGCLLNGDFKLPFDYKWQLILHMFAGISYCLVQLTSLEFILAQTPKSMRGILVGLWYGISGVMSIVHVLLFFLFLKIKSGPLGCSFYYFLTKSVLSLLVLIVFLILAKRYKLRVRENEIDVYVEVHERFTRYLDEEERCRH